MFLLAAVGLSLAAQDSTSYWQQEVHYQINARVDDISGVIDASERVVYLNRSPDTLDRIYFHLYLNAFRPGSRWADRDSIEGSPRFNNLADPDYAFERVARTSVNGVAVVPQYPYAPDSTIVLLMLPTGLATHDSAVISIDWQARPSTLPRRQGRRGRRMDLAQWYPRVVAYDRYGWEDHPLYPMGEFYGEFGTYDVTLDLAADQVVGATGVPIEGDPGWESARADPNLQIDYQRDWYSSRHPGIPGSSARGSVGAPNGCAAVRIAPGRKCVRFYAEDVHHFAWSVNPDYIYEEGRFEDAVVRVLYQPGDTISWGGGVAVERTEIALDWLDRLFGDFPWPQLTNIHRIEGGGTEFPMMIHDGGASQGLILHEGGHNYLMGILANNEWREGFLDEGFTSFQTSWFFEEENPGLDAYSGIEAFILDLDLDGWSQPVSLVSEDYRDFATYSVMIYTKAQLFYRQLRDIVGNDTMKEILRAYFERWKFKHVTEAALLEVAEEVSGMDLGWFFAQWLHGSPIYDYAIGRVDRVQLEDGRWQTNVAVQRLGDGIFPVEIGTADGEPRSVYARATGRAENESVTFVTDERPGRLMLDPLVGSHDWNFTNNYERRPGQGRDRIEWRLDDFVHDPSRRDHSVASIAPTLFYNDASGLTPGVRIRSNYGRFNRWEAWFQRGVGIEDAGTETTGGAAVDFCFRVSDPVRLRRPNASQVFEAWNVEGTSGVSLRLERRKRKSWTSQEQLTTGFGLRWVATSETTFLDPALWDNGGTIEVEPYLRWYDPRGRTDLDLRVSIAAGIAYSRKGFGSRLADRYDSEGFGRFVASASVMREMGRWNLNLRGFLGGYLAESNPLRQRAVQVAGANPYETLSNPLVRARGALFARPDVFYHSPGEGNLRGLAAGLGGRWVAAAAVELERNLVTRRNGAVRELSVAAFTDAALVDTLAVAATSGNAVTPLLDAGIGLRTRLQVGDVNFPFRLEMPFFVNRPAFAVGAVPGDDKLAFRWVFSFERAF